MSDALFSSTEVTMVSRIALAAAAAAFLPALAVSQAAWSVVTPAPGATPPGLTSAGSATDGANYYVYAGRIASPAVATPHLIDELWRFDGAGWIQISASGPGNREKPGLVWDVVRQKLVMFGGQDLSAVSLNDTWEWDATNGWVQMTPAVSPSPRYWFSMSYAPFRQRTILFGGMDGATYHGDTWEWDGASWTLLSPANSPAARGRHQTAFDLRRGGVVLFGGTNSNPAASFSDTWLWNGSDWSPIPTATIPYGTGCVSPAMAYDPLRGRIVLNGGYNGSYRGETWELDGTDWIARGSFPVMPGRGGPTATFVPALGRTYLYGGFNSTGGGAFPWNTLFASVDNQLYEYQTNYLAAFGENPGAPGCASSLGTTAGISATSLPWAGTTTNILVNGIPSGAPVFMFLGFTPGSIGLGVIGAPGCTVQITSPFAFATTTSGSTAAFQLPLPNSSNLFGAAIYLQGAVVDFAANPLGLVLSGRGDGIIGAF